jgi:hypothetical protein
MLMIMPLAIEAKTFFHTPAENIESSKSYAEVRRL